MRPKPAGRSDARLDLVDDQKHAFLSRHLAQTLEEFRRRMQVASFGSDRLDHHRRDLVLALLLVRADHITHGLEGRLLCALVLLGMLLERVLDGRPIDHWPRETRDVKLVDCLRTRRAQRAKETAVESGAEGEDREVGRAGGAVGHARRQFFGGELGRATGAACALPMAIRHERGLESGLVGATAAHGRKDLIETLWRDAQEAILDELFPFLRWEHAERHAVHGHAREQVGARHLEQVRVVVADGDARDLRVHVEQPVAIDVDEVVADRVGVVGHEHVRAVVLE